MPTEQPRETEKPTDVGNAVAPRDQVHFGTPTRVWYGSQTLVADVIATTPLWLLAAMDGSGAEVLLPLTLGMYALGGPIVHTTHKNWGRAFGSLSIRIGAPIICVLPLVAIPSESAVTAGIILGAGLAVTLDATVLARETVVKETAWQPIVRVGKDNVWVGITGRL